MKKLLFQFDTDPYPSVFDTVVAYDGGADRVTGYANVTPDTVGPLVDGTIFTRGGKDKQNTAIFVGGGDMVGKAIGCVPERSEIEMLSSSETSPRISM